MNGEDIMALHAGAGREPEAAGRRTRERLSAVRIAGAVLIVLVLCWTSLVRDAVWSDDVLLWEDVIAKTVLNFRAYANLGLAYKQAGRREDALRASMQSLAIRPNAPAYNNAGNVYLGQGRFEQAIGEYSKAVELQPDKAEYLNNRGIAYFNIRRFASAVADYTRALAIAPQEADMHVNLGNAYDESGRPDLAIDQYGRAIAIDPTFANAYLNRGVTLQRAFRIGEARVDFEKACSLGSTAGCDAVARLGKGVVP